MNFSVSDIIVFCGVLVQVFALLIAVGKIITTTAASEARNAERHARVETKIERIERDIDTLYRATSKRANDSE